MAHLQFGSEQPPLETPSPFSEGWSQQSHSIGQRSTAYSVGSISNDEPRIIWLKTIIANMLGVFDPKYVNELISKNQEAVSNFLKMRYEGQKDLHYVLMFVWRTFHDRLVEEEITVLEEVPRPPRPSVPEKKGKGKKGKGDAKGGRQAAGAASKQARKKGGQDVEAGLGRPSTSDLEPGMEEGGTYTGGETTDADMEGELEGEEEATVAGSGKSSARSRQSRRKKKKATYVPVYVEVKKLVPAYVKTPVLHCHFGEMDSSTLDAKIKYVYILRKDRREIPSFNEIANCFAEMPLFFLLGTVRGSLINSLRDDLNLVYKSAIQYQFREPTTTDSQQMDSYEGQAAGGGGAAGDAGEDVSSEAKESGPGLLELSKPSEFRLKALKLQKKKKEQAALAKKQEKAKSLKPEGDTEADDEEEAAEGPAKAKDIISSSEEEAEHKPEKLTIGQRWEKMLTETKAKVEAEHAAEEATPPRITPIQRRILKEIDDFEAEINWTINHIVWAFSMPSSYILPGQEEVEFEEALIRVPVDPKRLDLVPTYTQEQLEQVVQGWIKYLNKTLKSLMDAKLDEFTPMAEYRYWHKMEVELYGTIEQLKTAFVLAVLDRLRSDQSNMIAEWEKVLETTENRFKLAKENSDYLGTITDYLEKVRSFDSFKMTVLQIPNIMVGLRHIWTMSSYYCRDPEMQVLLCEISNVFVQKVKKIINFENIFRYSSTYTHETATNCANLLRCWKQAYKLSRQHIEESGAGSRWEFDRVALFSEVNHIHRVAVDIAYIGRVFIQYENLFGHRLKALIADPSIVDNLMRKVYRMLDDLMNSVDYDMFRPGNWENWEYSLEQFNRRLESLEQEAKGVIDQSINSLLSSEKGLQLVTNAMNIDTRKSLQEFVATKHENLLRYFVTEINTVERVFMKNKKFPPMSKHQPAKISAISWARLLGRKLKNSVLAFKRVEDDPALKNSFLKRSSFKQYFELMTTMYQFEKVLFESFVQSATYLVNHTNRSHILAIRICNTSTMDYISDAVQTLKTRPREGASQMVIAATQSPSHLQSVIHSGVSLNTSFGSVDSLKDGEDEATMGDTASKTLMCRINRFTVLTAMIMWMVSNTRQANLQLQKCLLYIAQFKEKKAKDITAMDRHCLKICELMERCESQRLLPIWRELVDDKVLIEYDSEFVVNLNREIFDTLFEGQLFEHLGFELPSVLRTEIMRKDLLFKDYEKLSEVINRYKAIIANLSMSEVIFLRGHIYDTELYIQMGLGRYTWISFNIGKFCEQINSQLRKLTSIVSQINFIRLDLRNRIDLIKNYNLFNLDSETIDAKKSASVAVDFTQSRSDLGLQPVQSRMFVTSTGASITMYLDEEEDNEKQKQEQYCGVDVYPCEGYFELLESSRNRKAAQMKKLYDSLGPVLVKLESLVLGTFTGRSDKMKTYYEFWEEETYKCIVDMTYQNLKCYINRLLSDSPMFEVNAVLLMSEIVLEPSIQELQNIIITASKDFLSRLKIFTRWMAGTCLACPQIETGAQWKFNYTFYEDIVQIKSIVDLIINIHDLAGRIASEAKGFVTQFRKYFNLWAYEKSFICQKFVQRQVTLIEIDEKFTFYSAIVETMASMRKHHDVKCVRINLKPLLESITQHAQEWCTILGEELLLHVNESMRAMRSEIKTLSMNLNKTTRELEDFKLVMQTIATIQSTTLTNEQKIHEMQETFTVLSEHKIMFPYEDMLMAHHLEKRWKRLFLSALYRSEKLQPIKQKFADMTSVEIDVFCDDLDEFIKDWDENGPGSVGGELERGVRLMDPYGQKINERELRRQELANAERLFDMPMVDYHEFGRVQTEYEGLQQIYKLYRSQKGAREIWGKTLWADLDPNVLTEGVESYLKEFRKLPKPIRQQPVGTQLELHMKQFKGTVPLMVSLKHEALRERHWLQLMEKTGQYFDMSPARFTLENMFTMQLHKYQEIAEQILTNAIKELQIERGVRAVEETWAVMAFKVLRHYKGLEDRGWVLGPVDEISQMLEDNGMNLQSMGASQFIGPFLETVNKWERTLAMVSEIIDEWLVVQRKWLYLEGIFIGGDIRTQLPEEAKKFDDIDKAYRRIMVDCAKNPLVVPFCTIPGRLVDIQGLGIGLEKCQKSLNEYLDSKRRIFPRFYFISTDELLSILGSSEPSAVQNHIIKMYDNIKSLRLVKEGSLTLVTAMISSEGEVMEFRHVARAQGRVEYWMNDVLDEMRRSNRFISKTAIYDFGTDLEIARPDWLMNYQGMVGLAASQVWWTAEVEEAFDQAQNHGNMRAMKDFLSKNNHQIEELVLKVRSNLSRNDRLKFKAQCTVDVHARDIIDSFVRDNVLDASEFSWESQLRFYWVKFYDNLHVFQCSGSFDYGYEYMGLNGRLVITPLTDRIYLTITQALLMNLGGAPAGPAGTGKTETVKDLAKAMGLLCVVTNCGEGMDYRAVGTILSGLVQCGAWGCFDEFNRIDISVLSVISTQLQTIRNGLIRKLERFVFEGVEIKLDPKCGVFVTMNPGYAGRTELPESVKALFRPVTCIKPDLELICLISLFSDGFLTAKVLAKKMTVLYALAQEQLSKQCHYDWGLRSLNSVLRMAGVMKRQSEDLPEAVVLMRVLRDMNYPKFIFEDVPLFLGLIKDLFPGIDCPRVGYPDFNSAVRHVLVNDGYILLPDQEDKVVQMYETMMTRHSTMIVGPTGGGKTVVINALVKAQAHMGLPTKCIVLNPKACSVIELYGYLDMETRDWIDGLFSNIFREMNKPIEREERRYACFDGDVDALWIENMNSVMDDNKLLTLANGERIRLENYCALLFEVGNLSYASPATVSRAGMVYVDPKNLRYNPYWQRWVLTRPEPQRELLNDFFEKIIVQAIAFILEGIDGTTQGNPLKLVILQTDLNMVTQFCNIYDALLPVYGPSDNKNYDEPVLQVYNVDTLECCFLQGVYGSMGACLLERHQIVFDEFMKRISGFPLFQDTPENPASGGQFPQSKPTLYDYFWDMHENCWKAWEWIVRPYTHDATVKFSEILVPTVDNTRTNRLLALMSEIKRPVLLVGEAGTSKTATIMQYLRNLNSNVNIILNINFSSRTSSLDVQRTLEAAVEKRTKDTYGPPMGKKIACFIDDMNMPQVDDYGTQQPIALLKLFFERGGMYDRDKDLNWKKFKDMTFYAAMGTAGGGRNEVDPRFISMFSTYNIVFPNDESLVQIYSSIFKGHLQFIKFPERFMTIADIIVVMTLKLFKLVIVDLPPTPSKFHYIFNLKDLSRIFAGLLLIEPTCFKNLREFIRVWRNEFTRIICDRLIADADINGVRRNLALEVGERFPPEFEEQNGWIDVNTAEAEAQARLLYEAYADDAAALAEEEGEEEQEVEEGPQVIMSLKDYVLRDPILFGDFRNFTNEAEARLYEDLLDYDSVWSLFIEILEEYCDRKQKMTLVLFEDCVEHLTRVHRTLRMNRGHVLLIGVGGCGKKCITRLAAFAAECEVFEITISRGYNEAAFREDLKVLYTLAGVKRKKVVFLFTAAQVAEEGFLELINNILTVGQVPALFADEDKDTIVNQVRKFAEEEGLSASKDSVWSYFLRTCAENLHVVLCMSPAGEALRNRCRNFPGLIGSTYIDWVFPWPKQALYAVARLFLTEHAMIPAAHRDNIIEHVVHVHTTIQEYSKDYQTKLRRNNFVTPKHYLDYINTYLGLLEEKHLFITQQRQRLGEGIKKIEEASLQIDELRIIVTEQKKNVAVAAEECESMLVTIEASTVKANTKKAEASEKSVEVEIKGKQIAVEKDEAEEILADAMPALEEARRALSELEKAQITEIRSFATPPAAVQVVCECVAILKGIKEISWKSAKGMMSDVNFLKGLMEMDCEALTQKQITACRNHMKTQNLDDMGKISIAGAGLLKFVKAVIGFFEVYREVKPKKERVDFLVEEQEVQIKLLNHLNAEITKLEDKLAALNENYAISMKQMKALTEMMQQAERRLIASDKLISGLSSELIRWSAEMASLGQQLIDSVGVCLISSSFLAYTGAFTWEFRKAMVFDDWLEHISSLGIPVIHPFKIDAYLSTDVEVAQWTSEGLPPDELSVQNGILTMRASRFPLCIDPQLQALQWIRKKEFRNNLKVLSFSDFDFLKQLEMAIMYGLPVLFEDVDDYIDPVIDDILQKNIRVQAGRKFVMLGDKEVDWDPGFRLYLTTKFSNPKFDPAVYAKALVINYTVTQTGLEDQLLSVVVGTERPDLEQQRESLIEQTSENKQLLKQLEDSLLRELATSTGNMLDNVELVETLENTKSKAGLVMEQLKLAAETAADIEILRNGYRPTSKRGAVLFFALADMATVNSMYQYALAAYLDVFVYSLRKAVPDTVLSKRLNNIIKTLTENVYSYGCTGIFERHKLLFSFQIATKLAQREGILLQSELDFFIKGNIALTKSERSNPCKWLPEKSWEDLLKLAFDFPDPFGSLPDHFGRYLNEWKEWYDLENPEEVACPGDYNINCNAFQKLLFLRCFRVDRIFRCINQYIVDTMDEFFIMPPVVSFSAIYEQTSCTIPVCFILSAGSDPTSDLIKLADTIIGVANFCHISLGQGQEKAALKMLDTAVRQGQWLMLQNGHLLIRFVRELEKYLDRIDSPHPDFRLWITTDPSPAFPIGILQKSLKVVTEPPNGLKLNLRSTYFKVRQERLESCSHRGFRPLVYVLAFFHAVVQERRKYDKLGWNIAYDFNDSDFEVCTEILRTYLSRCADDKIPWNSLKYLIGEVMYGGRVIDDFDRRITNCYMSEYMGDFLFDEFQVFHFYEDENVDYCLPEEETVLKEDYIAHIDKLPLVNKPDVFGLHPNAEIGYYTMAARNIWNSLIELQPQTGEGTGGISRDDFIDSVAAGILKKLPPAFETWRIRKQIQMSLSPTGVVLLQELDRFNLLVIRIKKTLELLRKAIAGEIGMDNVLDNIANSLFNGLLPTSWSSLAPATCKQLASWLEHLRQRSVQYKYWSISGEPLVMWLSGLHIPQSYLTALVQIACRKNAWPLDRSTLFTYVTNYADPDDVEERPATGCFVHGLYIEGARFDMSTNQLARSHPKVLVEELAILAVEPIEAHRLKLQNTFLAPVYTTSLRRNAMGVGLVFEANLATSEDLSHWILQGVCLTLNTDT
ncbi:dynein heavy chain 10, axonemal [Drosophila guanche]|uniref:Dynein-1, subspecies f n=1 Tax=Drosophila guanche TaxID=7266 RepID=A0A3B0JD27_DROGU|nr:dynein heavy chain 10, axonemal [Drosophila guanche]SPP80284.1 blast:Dynein heavy chain 10%2C axonemal [Drosophila guanche]